MHSTESSTSERSSTRKNPLHVKRKKSTGADCVQIWIIMRLVNFEIIFHTSRDGGEERKNENETD